MSVPKQLAKMQRLARKRKRKQEARRRQKQRRGWASGEPVFFDIPNGTRGVRFDAPGAVKMSEILEDFVRPLTEGLGDKKAYCRALTLGVLAWNAALRPEPQRQKMVDEVIAKGLRGESAEVQETCKQIVRDLILRKQRYFAQYRRPILDFHLEDIGSGYHLTVISLLE